MRNLTRVFASNVMLPSVIAFLFSVSVVLAQDQPDKSSDTVYELGNGVTPPRVSTSPILNILKALARRRSTVTSRLR